MRVIAGSARRLLLKTPDGLDTRPTTDRIKETLFNRENIINEDDFIRSKKVMIANKIKASCYIDAVGDSLYEDLINYNKIITNKVDLIRQLKYENLLKVSNNLDLSNNSIVCYVPKDDNFEIKN